MYQRGGCIVVIQNMKQLISKQVENIMIEHLRSILIRISRLVGGLYHDELVGVVHVVQAVVDQLQGGEQDGHKRAVD